MLVSRTEALVLDHHHYTLMPWFREDEVSMAVIDKGSVPISCDGLNFFLNLFWLDFPYRGLRGGFANKSVLVSRRRVVGHA